MESTNFFGLKQEEYNSLLSASSRNAYNPSPALVEKLMDKYPKISEETASTALKLINSPARNTFTSYDVFAHLKSI